MLLHRTSRKRYHFDALYLQRAVGTLRSKRRRLEQAKITSYGSKQGRKSRSSKQLTLGFVYRFIDFNLPTHAILFISLSSLLILFPRSIASTFRKSIDRTKSGSVSWERKTYSSPVRVVATKMSFKGLQLH